MTDVAVAVDSGANFTHIGNSVSTTPPTIEESVSLPFNVSPRSKFIDHVINNSNSTSNSSHTVNFIVTHFLVGNILSKKKRN